MGYIDSMHARERFELENNISVKPQYNIRPEMSALVVTRNSPNKGELMEFGVRVPWMKSGRLINAQSETASEKKTFQRMFPEHRALLPADFYFEWLKLHEGGKQPFCFRLKSHESFALATIYDPEQQAFVILTCAPNSLQKPIHHRMPCILAREDEDGWLNPDTPVELLLPMLKPYPSELMEKFPVSKIVNFGHNEDPNVIKQVEFEEQPKLVE